MFRLEGVEESSIIITVLEMKSSSDSCSLGTQYKGGRGVGCRSLQSLQGREVTPVSRSVHLRCPRPRPASSTTCKPAGLALHTKAHTVWRALRSSLACGSFRLPPSPRVPRSWWVSAARAELVWSDARLDGVVVFAARGG